MGESSATCWTLIRGAAAGKASDREMFARYYHPAVRAYLGARWRSGPLAADLDDATQEVFLECFRGVLHRADRSRSFRTLLYGVVRNVARRFAERRARLREVQPSSSALADRLASEEASLSLVFDRAWAESIVSQAKEQQAKRAREQGEDALRRVELLRLRFEEDEPVRAIATRWGVEAQWLHNQYAKARKEFRQALLEVVGFHQPGSRAEIEAECTRLLRFFE